MPTAGSRPAHRPSRRGTVIDAAMHLFAVRPIESVTVADIAEEGGMTAAAIYYHYPSKDDLLLDGLRIFAEQMLERLQEELAQPWTEGGIGAVLVAMLEWAEEHRYPATVYFVTSPGLSIGVESLRRETRNEIVTCLAKALRSRRKGMPVAEANVAAAGLLYLLEQAAPSWLTEDTVLANLGRRRFSLEVIGLADRISG